MVKEFKEKIITINLRKAFDKPMTKRAKSALYILKQAVRKETKKDNIKISNQVNEELWQNGLFKSIRKITIKVIHDKEMIRVLMPNEKFETREKNDKKTIKEKLEEKEEVIKKDETKTIKKENTKK